MNDTWTSESYNAEGIDVDKTFEPIPEGRQDLEIEEAAPGFTTKGFKKVTLTLRVINSIQHAGRKIMFQNVTILPKENPGAFLALKFLKAIGQPHKGDFKIVPSAWIGGRFSCYVKVKEYEKKDGSKGLKNEIELGGVAPYGGPENAPSAKESEEEVPF